MGISAISSTSPYLYGHIASGKRLMSAANGASELAVAEKQKALITGYNTATMNASNRAELQKEVNQLKQGIEHIATQSRFNGKNLLDGSQSEGVTLVSDASGGSITVNNSMDSTLQALGIADFDVTKNFDLQAIDDALVASNRSSMGAQSNAIDHTMNYNEYASENLTASLSRLSDTDIAKKVQELTHQRTLQDISMYLQKKKMGQEGQKMVGALI